MSNQASGGGTLPRDRPGPLSGAQCTRPEGQKLTLGTWNIGTMLGKEKELVRDVERYKLDIVGLTSTHSPPSSAKTLDMGWTLFFSGVEVGINRQAGVGILINPRLEAMVLKFIPVDKRVASLRLMLKGGITLTVVCAYAPNRSQEYPTFLETLQGVLGEVPVEEFVVLLGDFNAHVGDETNKWPDVIGSYGLPGTNPNGTLLLKFCDSHELCITNTMFDHADPHTFHREKVDKETDKTKTLIDFVIIPTRWMSHVLDTWVEKRTELSTDHYLVVSQIRKWGTLVNPAIPITTNPNTIPPITKDPEDDISGRLTDLSL